jgi:alpha-beta hydrolase superfamily lysophospholipase
VNELSLAVAVLLGLVGLAGIASLIFWIYLRTQFLGPLVRIFEERPLFIIPRGRPITSGEEVRFPGGDGLMLHGWYWPTPARRRGVILFGLEFGSTCEACTTYCDHLLAGGFDIFTFEPRNQGGSDSMPGYEPLQWVTDYEVADFQAALDYLKTRADADPAGVGLFGISKGGGAGLIAAADNPYIRCCVTDGAFATHTTMVPYMRKWVRIYSDRRWLQKMLPTWVYSLFARAALRRIERLRHCRFSHLERAIGQLAPRPLLMIHGGDDTYIKADMAQSLFAQAGAPKTFWLVGGAKHNQALHVAGEEYRRRVCDFFQTHLDNAGESQAGSKPAAANARGRTGLPVFQSRRRVSTLVMNRSNLRPALA